jgi:hypothetical protein
MKRPSPARLALAFILGGVVFLIAARGVLIT